MAHSSVVIILCATINVILLFMSGDAIRCSICDTLENGESCRTHPPAPVDCPGHDYCIAVARYAVDGSLKSFTRSCSPLMSEDACVPGTDRITGESLRMCYSTCARNGCNSSRSLHHLLDLLRRRKK